LLPPDLIGQPVQNVDSLEIRTNPRTFPSTPTGDFSTDKLFIFTIDFSRIPVRKDGLPYFIRATVADDVNPPIHAYATGRLTVSGLANGFVDLRDVGVNIAGARFHGFTENEMLGSLMLALGDQDNDSVDDFLLVGR